MNEQNEGRLSIYQGQRWTYLGPLRRPPKREKRNALKGYACLSLNVLAHYLCNVYKWFIDVCNCLRVLSPRILKDEGVSVYFGIQWPEMRFNM